MLKTPTPVKYLNAKAKNERQRQSTTGTTKKGQQPMAISRPQAEDVARIIHALRPDFPPAAVAAKIAAPELQANPPLNIITAAFMTAADPAAQTIQVLTTKLTDLTTAQGWATHHTAHTQHTSTNDNSPPCPAHPWAPARNCSPCHSEIKAGERPASAYGAKTYTSR